MLNMVSHLIVSKSQHNQQNINDHIIFIQVVRGIMHTDSRSKCSYQIFNCEFEILYQVVSISFSTFLPSLIFCRFQTWAAASRITTRYVWRYSCLISLSVSFFRTRNQTRENSDFYLLNTSGPALMNIQIRSEIKANNQIPALIVCVLPLAAILHRGETPPKIFQCFANRNYLTSLLRRGNNWRKIIYGLKNIFHCIPFVLIRHCSP